MKVADMPGAIKKPWGWTVDLICEPTLQISLLDIRAGTCSSQHYHESKHNRFIVRCGVLSVFLGLNASEERVLRTGDVLDILSGQIHQFIARTDCRVLEAYTPNDDEWRDARGVRADDIVRLTRSMVAK